MARGAKGGSVRRSAGGRGGKARTVPEAPAEAPGRWVATSFVSNDVVRSNLVPGLVRAGGAVAEALGGDAPPTGAGAVSARVLHHVVMSGAGADVAHLALEDFVELVDYDPVRHVALVVGRRSAPREAPLLWLLHRVFPAAQVCCVVPAAGGREAQPIDAAPRGSFEEAMAAARVLRGPPAGEGGARGGDSSMPGPAVAVLERVGLVLVVPPTEDLGGAIQAALRVTTGGSSPRKGR